MFKKFKKSRISRMFQTDSEPSGMAWLERFILLRNEAAHYMDTFTIAVGNEKRLGLELKALSAMLKDVDALDIEYGIYGIVEEAKSAVAHRKEELARVQEELIGRKGEALSEAQEAMEKLPPILRKIRNLPELKSERAQRLKTLWDSGAQKLISACESYISWCETGKLENLHSVASSLQSYIYYCGTWKTLLNSMSPEARASFGLEKKGRETLIELIQPFPKR